MLKELDSDTGKNVKIYPEGKKARTLSITENTRAEQLWPSSAHLRPESTKGRFKSAREDVHEVWWEADVTVNP